MLRYYFWTVLCYSMDVIFGKVFFTTVIMLYFFETNKGLIFWRIFFCIPC
jgi:hypothetical protein